MVVTLWETEKTDIMTRLLNPERKKENYKSPECPKIIGNCKHSSIFKYEFLSPENNQIMEFHLMLIFPRPFSVGVSVWSLSLFHLEPTA